MGAVICPEPCRAQGRGRVGSQTAKVHLGVGQGLLGPKLTLGPALGHPDVGALGGLRLASAWRTVIRSGCVGGRGSGGGGGRFSVRQGMEQDFGAGLGLGAQTYELCQPALG